MDARGVLEHRLKTLEGLLSGPTPLSGGSESGLADQLTGRWQAERRLLNRVLEEASHTPVDQVVGRWATRTERFLEAADTEDPGWTDAHGQYWDATVTFDLLLETQERLERWSGSPEEDQ